MAGFAPRNGWPASPLCVLLCAAVWVACSSAREPAPAPQQPGEQPGVQAAQQPTAQAPAQAPAPAKDARKATSRRQRHQQLTPAQKRALARDARDRFRAHLAEGRRLAKQKQYQAALVELDKARLIKPNHARVLSEIGWAAMKAGDLRRAERANLDSVRFAPDNNVKGASLYNLGRIAEERKDLQKAGEYYVQSLSVRRNATVEKRLAALKKAGVLVERDYGPTCAILRVRASGDGADLCEATARLITEPGQNDGGGGPTCEESWIDDWSNDELDIEHKHLDRALLFSVFVREETSDYIFLGLHYRKQWYVTQLAYVYNPGAFGIFEGMSAQRFEAEQLIPGGPPEIVVSLHKNRNDTDPGIDEEESIDSSLLFVVGIERGQVARLLSLVEDYSYHRDRMGLEEEEEEEDDDDDAEEDDEGKWPIEKKSGIDVSFDNDKGQVILKAYEDKPASHPAGTFMLATFPQPCVEPYY